MFFFFFFFNDTATTEIYTLSLHDALPIYADNGADAIILSYKAWNDVFQADPKVIGRDRKSTRLNSSHGYISYAVFCLKKKKRATAQQGGPAGRHSWAGLTVTKVPSLRPTA